MKFPKNKTLVVHSDSNVQKGDGVDPNGCDITLSSGSEIKESIEYMSEKITYFINCGQLEEADAFSNCLVGIFMDLSNKSGEANLIEAKAEYIVKGKICYEKCLELECKLGRLDYLAGTLGSLSKLNSLETSHELLQRGLF